MLTKLSTLLLCSSFSVLLPPTVTAGHLQGTPQGPGPRETPQGPGPQGTPLGPEPQGTPQGLGPQGTPQGPEPPALQGQYNQVPGVPPKVTYINHEPLEHLLSDCTFFV